MTQPTPTRPALLVVGHGTKSAAGCAEFAALVERAQLRAAYADVAGGFLELAPPPIQDGTHPSQRVVVSTLEHLAADVAAAGLRAPVATVIGDVVRLRETLRWFDRNEEP